MTDAQGRPEPDPAVGEAETLLGYLEFQRATLAWKCQGLDAAGLNRTVGVSTMTLGGLLKHTALNEASWFGQRLRGEALGDPWDAVDWDADPDWEWHSAAHDSPEQLWALWRASLERARRDVAAALAEGDLGQLARIPLASGTRASLRWIVAHMIEEYARHNGHADLIREAVDGQTGE